MPKANRQTDQVLDWLLEKDDPGVRYLALRDLAHAGPKELEPARKQAHSQGPIARVLDHMDKEGYWVKPGPGYNPKYKSTVWSMILLGQLGASIETDKRVAAACDYVLNHALTEAGHFTATGAPSGTIDCLQGNLCAALFDLGCRDSRLDMAFEWMARTVTGEGIAGSSAKTSPVRYYAAKCGPVFACGANYGQPCAWGGVKVLLALGKLPNKKHTRLIDEAIEQGVNFFFSTDPARANYPAGLNKAPNRSWWKFGFPVFYVTDVLQIVEVLVALGHGKDPRLANALALVREKQDADGRLSLEYDYTGKTWLDFGERRAPNKWVTLRARRVLDAVA